MLQYSPKIVTDGLVMCLDPSQNKSYPTDLPVKGGLALWLDAADDTTFSYSSGTAVSQWRDKSGNGRHFFQSTAGNQPSRSAVVNSRKAIQFTAASSQYLRYNSTIINNTTGGSVFVVWRTAGETQAYSSILNNYHCGNNALGAGFHIERNFTNNQYYWGFITPGCGNGGSIPATSYSNDATNCIWITKNSTTITGGLNGTSVTPNASPSSTWTEDTKGWLIGSWGSNVETFSRFFNGIQCEVIIFNRGLSPIEVKQVNTYLGQKWGILNTDRSIIDLSGNNNNGLLGDGTTADMPLFDVYNKGALKLDGSTDYIAVANATSLNPATVTVSIWVKRNGYQSQTANYLRRNYNDAYGILGDIASDNVRFRIYNGSTYPESPNATLSLNEWTNIVGTYDLANIKIYRNGVFVGQTAHTSAISYASVNTTMTIGRDDPVAGRYMNANYGSVLIYNRALSANEILQNYEAQKSKFTNTIVQQGLVLNLDAGNPYSYAGAGTTWFDVSGNGKIGTLTGGVTYSSLYGGDFILDGVNGYIQTNLNQNTDNAQITWEAWFWDNSPGGFVSNTAIISNYGASATTPYTSLHVYDTGNIFFGQRNSSGTADEAVYGTSICNGVWHHLVGVVDSSNMLLYVDGVIRASKTKITGTTTSGQNLVIGGNHLGRYQSCRIASARCYNIALSAAQVLQNYNATKDRFGL